MAAGTTDAPEGTVDSPDPEGLAGAPLLELLNGFIIELREAGLPVSLTENLDAMQAIRHIPLEDRETFKYALAATLVKNNAHWRAFETVFEVYFSLRGSRYAIDDDSLDPALAEALDDDERDGPGEGGQGGAGQGGGDALTPEELQQLLYQAMMKGDEALMRALARQAVKRFAGMEPGRPVGGTYYLYRTLRNLDSGANLPAWLPRLPPCLPFTSGPCRRAASRSRPKKGARCFVRRSRWGRWRGSSRPRGWRRCPRPRTCTCPTAESGTTARPRPEADPHFPRAGRPRRVQTARIRLLRGLCSTSASPRCSSTGGTYVAKRPRYPLRSP